MQIKKDDTVVVIAGKDKGKTGTVLRTIPKKNKVVVEGVNMQTKHARATRTSASEIKHMEGPIDASNVMFYDKDAKKATRIGHKVEDGKKVRDSKKSGKVIDEERRSKSGNQTKRQVQERSFQSHEGKVRLLQSYGGS